MLEYHSPVIALVAECSLYFHPVIQKALTKISDTLF